MTRNGSDREPDLRALLDAYGADRARWPAADRARADAVVAAEPQAERLLTETKALDALLAHAPVPSPERRAALGDRIVALAGAERPAAAPPSGVVVPWPGTSRRRAVPPVPRVRTPAWQAAAVLAASLALGFFVGALDLAPESVDRLAQAVTLDDADAVAGLSNDGLAAVLDEDFL
jgi:hypothetical protein